MSTGYSGRPLVAKLGIKPGMVVVTVGAPADYRMLLDSPDAVEFVAGALGDAAPPCDVAHLFTRERADLDAALPALREAIAPDGMIWVSWPKKASRVPTDVTEDVVRECAFPLGLVDVKVCAVDAVWSGLKLVIRKALR